MQHRPSRGRSTPPRAPTSSPTSAASCERRPDLGLGARERSEVHERLADPRVERGSGCPCRAPCAVRRGTAPRPRANSPPCRARRAPAPRARRRAAPAATRACCTPCSSARAGPPHLSGRSRYRWSGRRRPQPATHRGSAGGSGSAATASSHGRSRLSARSTRPRGSRASIARRQRLERLVECGGAEQVAGEPLAPGRARCERRPRHTPGGGAASGPPPRPAARGSRAACCARTPSRRGTPPSSSGRASRCGEQRVDEIVRRDEPRRPHTRAATPCGRPAVPRIAATSRHDRSVVGPVRRAGRRPVGPRRVQVVRERDLGPAPQLEPARARHEDPAPDPVADELDREHRVAGGALLDEPRERALEPERAPRRADGGPRRTAGRARSARAGAIRSSSSSTERSSAFSASSSSRAISTSEDRATTDCSPVEQRRARTRARRGPTARRRGRARTGRRSRQVLDELAHHARGAHLDGTRGARGATQPSSLTADGSAGPVGRRRERRVRPAGGSAPSDRPDSRRERRHHAAEPVARPPVGAWTARSTVAAPSSWARSASHSPSRVFPHPAGPCTTTTRALPLLADLRSAAHNASRSSTRPIIGIRRKPVQPEPGAARGSSRPRVARRRHVDGHRRQPVAGRAARDTTVSSSA